MFVCVVVKSTLATVCLSISPGVTELNRASVSGPGSSHINQYPCKSEREGRRGGAVGGWGG